MMDDTTAQYPPPELADAVREMADGSQMVLGAFHFAARAHGAIGQKRKYTGEPYIVHPVAVAQLVASVEHTPAMLAAALLHDVVEDTPVSLAEIEAEFGTEAAELVDWMTDVSKPDDGNRARRKRLDLLHIADAPPQAKTIKLADLIDNTRTIEPYDPQFWQVLRREKRALLEVLTEGDAELWRQAAART